MCIYIYIYIVSSRLSPLPILRPGCAGGYEAVQRG